MDNGQFLCKANAEAKLAWIMLSRSPKSRRSRNAMRAIGIGQSYTVGVDPASTRTSEACNAHENNMV